MSEHWQIGNLYHLLFLAVSTVPASPSTDHMVQDDPLELVEVVLAAAVAAVLPLGRGRGRGRGRGVVSPHQRLRHLSPRVPAH